MDAFGDMRVEGENLEYPTWYPIPRNPSKGKDKAQDQETGTHHREPLQEFGSGSVAYGGSSSSTFGASATHSSEQGQATSTSVYGQITRGAGVGSGSTHSVESEVDYYTEI